MWRPEKNRVDTISQKRRKDRDFRKLLLALAGIDGRGIVLSYRGFAFTAIIRTARSANMVSMIVFFMFMFLGATFFPTEVMPDFLRAVSNALPSTNLNDAFRGIMIMGAGISDVWHDLLIVGGWFIGSLVIAVRLFRWQ